MARLKRYCGNYILEINNGIYKEYCGSYLYQIDNRKFFCFAGIHAASILYNGDIFACPNIPRRPELIMGNIYKDSISDVWNNSFKVYREREDKKYCEGCKYKSVCRIGKYGR